MKNLTLDAMKRELEMRRAEYSNALDAMQRRILEAQAKAEEGRISHHDGFNLGAQASELQMLAGRIEFCEQIIRGEEEAK